MKRFTSALRLRTLEEYKGEETETWNYYLDSHLPTITCIPEYQSSDWTQIFNTLVSCLRQEKHSNLQYEAVCGIISLKAVKNLKRWDRIAYTKVLDEMLSLGTPKQKELAAIQCLETNDIDVRVIQQLRLGLGDTDEQRRKESIEVLGKLGVEFAKHVIQVLVQDAKHSSWRVRFDVATLLRVWIPRVAPRAMPPPPPRDPDALDTDNEEMLKALFPTGMAKHGGSSDGRLLSNAIMLSTNSITDYPGDEELHDKCIQILLEMMSNDWSLEVRGMAANSLADLQQGKSVLDWIVKSLRSADPTKRVDALKCLTHMATIPKERIDDYVKCFKDPYSSVKIEACRVLLFNKVACSIKSDDPKIVMALLDMMDDSEFKVRAYAVKGYRF